MGHSSSNLEKPINFLPNPRFSPFTRMIGDFMSDKVRSDTGSPTVRNIKNCLSAILCHAVNPDGYIGANPARGGRFPNPKTRLSSGNQPLAPDLKNHRKKLKEEALRKGQSNLPERVFPHNDGGPFNYCNLANRIWNRAVEK